MINYILPFFRYIFSSDIFQSVAYPCFGVGLISFFFLELYSFFDRRCS